jgi:hypothetical protein
MVDVLAPLHYFAMVIVHSTGLRLRGASISFSAQAGVSMLSLAVVV